MSKPRTKPEMKLEVNYEGAKIDMTKDPIQATLIFKDDKITPFGWVGIRLTINGDKETIDKLSEALQLTKDLPLTLKAETLQTQLSDFKEP